MGPIRAGRARIVTGALLVAGSIAALGLLTRFEYRAGTDRAALRLAWRTPAPRVVVCREPTAEELDALPVHMRRDEICEGRGLRYALEVRVDGVVRHRSLAGAAGARDDRPLYVFEDIALTPGRHEVRIVFERAVAPERSAGDAIPDTMAGAAGSEGDGPGAATVPDRMELMRTVEVASRDVVLVTYDADARQLVMR